MTGGAHVRPLLACLAVGLLIALAPTLGWYVKTGSLLYLRAIDSTYYLMIAARAYYSHSMYMSDPYLQGGIVFYTWLQFVPFVLLLRVLGLNIFFFNLISDLSAAIGLSLGSYFLFVRYLRGRWTAAACAVFILADYGLCDIYSWTQNLFLILSWFHHHVISLPFLGLFHAHFTLWQWRTPNPALDLPFLFLQVIAVSVARERRTLGAAAISGVAFGVLFYVYFYAWTLVAAALCIALVADCSNRKTYFVTLGIGLFLGVPELVRDSTAAQLASPQALARFGLWTPYPRTEGFPLPYGWIVLLTLVGCWIWKKRQGDLIFLWGLAVAGILLGRERIVTGIYLHEYHWDWLWPAFATIVLLIVVASRIEKAINDRRHLAWAVWGALLIYALGAVYLASPIPATLWTQNLIKFAMYQQQRMKGGIPALAPRSLIAGDEAFCDLAAVAEDQWVLADSFLSASLALDNSEWEARVALDALLEGTSRSAFAERAEQQLSELWSTPARRDVELAAMLRLYDKFSFDPTAYADAFGVRYVSIRVGSPPPGYLAEGWTLIQPGPFWQIWERKKAGERRVAVARRLAQA